jgi:formyl-CoA transferase
MGLYETPDGPINIAAPWGRLWQDFCVAIGRPGLPTDPRFARPSDRARNRDELNREITEALRAHTSREWVELLNEAGVPAGPVNDIAETFADPQVRHLAIATPVVHNALGRIEILRNATRIDGVPDEIRLAAPEAGEHADEILRQFGLSDAEIADLRAREVI